MKKVLTSKPHIVQVVSILEVPNKLASTSFQSNDVNGAQKSEFLFCNETTLYIKKTYPLILHKCLIVH